MKIKKAQRMDSTERRPATEELSEEELERLVKEEDSYYTQGRKPAVQHNYETWGEPDRLRTVGDNGSLWDVYPMPDGTVAVEPVTLKVVYNPQKMKKYDSWEEAQQALDSVCPGCSPYRAINASLAKRTLDDILDSPLILVGQHKEDIDYGELGERIGIDWDSVGFTPEDLKIGYAVELEHGTRDPDTDVTDDDEETTAKIAWAHLKESPRYYELLAQMEDQF